MSAYRAVLAKLMLPEALCCSGVGRPVDVHVVQKILPAECLQDLGDVGVLARLVAVLCVRAIAVVGPET